MAILRQQHCFICKKTTGHINGKCSLCEAEHARLARREHFEKLDALTLEQRVRRIEELLYEQSTQPTNLVDGGFYG